MSNPKPGGKPARPAAPGTVLVTGGAGYLGAVLVPILLDRGYGVRVYDKLYFGEEGLADVRERIELVQGDLQHFDAAVLDGVDAVAHLGGLSNDPTANFNPIANYKINTVATRVIAEACKARGIERFTFASSASIYDLGLDADDDIKTEDDDVNPINPYSTSNYESERILFQLQDKTFRPVSLRQGTVYGYSPRMRFDLVVNTFFKDALVKGVINVHNGGEMWRPMVDVADVARAHVACLEAPLEKVGGQVFNVMHRNYRILELAHYVVHCLRDVRDVRINVEYSDRANRSYRLSAERIKRAIGFETQVDVQKSLAGMVEAFVGKVEPLSLLQPKYYNIEWMKLLYDAEQIIRRAGSIF